ncbi:MAG: LTA synthase family protein, partial [Pseudorhodoplanes sp.]
MSVTSLPSPERRLSALFSYRISARTAFFAIAALHGIAIAVLLRTEIGVFPFTLALASWAMLNCLWLTVVDRPGTAAALSLAMILVLITVSLFKFDVIWMTASFLDVLIIDPDTIAFLFKIFPDMRGAVAASLLIGVPLLFVIWRLDPFRVRRRVASLGAAASFAIVAAMSLAVPEQPSEPFQGINHVSGFFRSGILAGSELARQGWLESSPGHYGARASEPLGAAASETCKPAGPRPNIIMVLDESSFDASVGPGIKLPPDYTRYFQSFDGRIRQFEVEGTGGPTWYTEYNVLTGLSARSFGKLMFYVTRIAAGRVERGLP